MATEVKVKRINDDSLEIVEPTTVEAGDFSEHPTGYGGSGDREV